MQLVRIVKLNGFMPRPLPSLKLDIYIKVRIRDYCQSTDSPYADLFDAVHTKVLIQSLVSWLLMLCGSLIRLKI
jgi:hypothetical protein